MMLPKILLYFSVMNGHICHKPETFPREKFHQLGVGNGKKVLIIGESPAPKGWVVSGKACYRPDGKILPTGKRLNEVLEPFKMSVETTGFTELVKCFVSKRSELKDCSSKCWKILLDQLKDGEYKLLIILGVHTTSLFSKLIEEDLEVGQISSLTLNKQTYKVLPIFHPSPVNPTGHKKNIKLFKELEKEIKLILK